MASSAEPLEYTTTVLRVSIHCEGCKKKVKKVLHGIEGVYKVTVDAPQHKVTVTGSVGADALVRRLNKAGKQAALWPPAPEADSSSKKEEVCPDAKKPEEEKLQGDGAESSSKKKEKEEVCPDAKKPKEGDGADGCAKKKPEAAGNQKPEKDKEAEGCDKAPEKDDGNKKQQDSGASSAEATEKKNNKKKGSPEPAAKEVAAAEEASAKKGKKKTKQSNPADKKQPPHPPAARPSPPPPPQQQLLVGPDHRGGFPYYAPPPVMSYNVTHPSASVSYYAPTPAAMHPPEYMYGPPGMRASPPRESYNDNLFSDENAGSCSVM